MAIHRQRVTRRKGFSPLLLFQNGPELLPRKDMLILLTRVIGTGSPRLQVSPRLHNHCQDSASVSSAFNRGKYIHLLPEAAGWYIIICLLCLWYWRGGDKIPVSFFSCEFYASNSLQFSPGVILFLPKALFSWRKSVTSSKVWSKGWGGRKTNSNKMAWDWTELSSCFHPEAFSVLSEFLCLW